MRIADAIVKYLELNEVKYVFGIPASTFSGIDDALNDTDIGYIVTKNEAGASYSATKYADLSKKIGVCLLAGGVGVNNAINGIADAKRNKLPLLIISGDVNSFYKGKGGIQEFDNSKTLGTITKYSKNIVDGNEALNEVEKAIKIALTPPYGPVSLSIPLDIQKSEFKGQLPLKKLHIEPKEYDENMLDKAIKEIDKSKKGIILVGRGTRGLGKEVKSLSEKLKWPVISTPNAKSIVNTDFKYYLGNYGFCTADGAIEYVRNTKMDCVLILGTSLGQAATRDYNEELVANKKVIRIDWDKNEFNKVFNEDISVEYDLKEAIKIINSKITKKTGEFKKPEMNKPYVRNHTGMSLRLVMEKISEILPKDSCVIGDIGDFCNYIFKYMPMREDMDCQTSINYASMGNAVAGSMGSYLSNPNRTYAAILGDGCFYMNGLEILTAKEYNMPIIYFVVNNSMLGLVNNGQTYCFGRGCKGKVKFSKNSIASVAESLGIDSVRVNKYEDFDLIKDKMLNRHKPLVVEIITDGSEIMIDPDRLGVISDDSKM
ncbi:thiamine pyrophosphate-binding protein [Clostridium oceanicum]|uniref:Acetolactate synthase large subunit n=1 Tax=Clostridium oceanicum TaxID=1543 RepID=A0ABP3UXK8_9CLOT